MPKGTPMTSLTRRLSIVTILAVLALGLPATARADDGQLMKTLRAGDNVILVRHGATYGNQADSDPFHLDNVAAQRTLTDKGKALAKGFGEALRAAELPIGNVYTSRFDRAYQTAALAGLQGIETSTDITEGGLVVTTDENNRRAAALRAMLATPPKPATNTIIVTHRPNILDALGKDWFDVKEGEASIFHVENGAPHLIARVQMDQWARVVAAN
jgi:broad specificity phosphatase PhoE